MTSKELLNLIKDYYGYKVKCAYLEKINDELEVSAVLYESFVIKCSVSEYHNEFGAGILLGMGIRLW